MAKEADTDQHNIRQGDRTGVGDGAQRGAGRGPLHLSGGLEYQVTGDPGGSAWGYSSS